MERTISFLCVSTLTINIDDLVARYKKVKETDGITVEEYMEDFWAGLDDNVYYCDNAEEIQQRLCREIKQSLDGMEKIYVINIHTNKYVIVDSFEAADGTIKELTADGKSVRLDYIVLDEEGFKNYMADGNK